MGTIRGMLLTGRWARLARRWLTGLVLLVVSAGAELGAERAAEEGIHPLSGAVEWDVLEDIPNDSAAALILLEHHWAVPLRDAIARAGGFRLSDGFISPFDLVAIGMMTAEEAKELHAMETENAAAG